MPGHIRRRDDKGKRTDGTTKWEAVHRNPLNPTQRRSKTFRNKQIATRWLHEQDTQAYAGTYVDPRKADRPLNQVADEWRNTWLNLEPKTIQGYQSVLTKHILPQFGFHRVGSLTPESIQIWVTNLTQGPPRRGANTVRNIYAVLRGLLRFAQSRRYITVNPCDAVRLPKVIRANNSSQLFLSPAEVAELASSLPQPYDTAVYVAAYCGLRAGELWALRRQDIDLLRGTITVSRAFKEVYGKSVPGTDLTDTKSLPGRRSADTNRSRGPVSDGSKELRSSNSGLIIGAPKSQASRRTVSMPLPVKSLLATYLAGPLPGGNGRADELIFTTAIGFPVRHGRFYGCIFKPAVRALWPAGHPLHKLRWHDLRHTCASLSLAITPNLHIVKERLGHESITTTIDIYGHLLPSVDAALMDGLGALFESATTPPSNIRELRSRAGAEGSS